MDVIPRPRVFQHPAPPLPLGPETDVPTVGLDASHVYHAWYQNRKECRMIVQFQLIGVNPKESVPATVLVAEHVWKENLFPREHAPLLAEMISDIHNLMNQRMNSDVSNASHKRQYLVVLHREVFSAVSKLTKHFEEHDRMKIYNLDRGHYAIIQIRKDWVSPGKEWLDKSTQSDALKAALQNMERREGKHIQFKPVCGASGK